MNNEMSQLLTEARAAMLTLVNMPYQRSWIEHLQEIQLKMEVAGTTKIEGADFSEDELELALTDTDEVLFTRSQRQARAAKNTYSWIAGLALDTPITFDLIKELHRRMVTGADDDHCPPGKIRERDQNVIFGSPSHRGAEGGPECKTACEHLERALASEFRDHDILIQALALHYHFAAIHPFLDGNGRTARAVEALFFRRAGLTEKLFVAMSNYYYDEKQAYLKALGEVRSGGHDLSPFLLFGLKGIKLQFQRLFAAIQKNLKKTLFRDTMGTLFGRLRSPRKRIISARQTAILELFLEKDRLRVRDVIESQDRKYDRLKAPTKAVFRDLINLLEIEALKIATRPEPKPNEPAILEINLDWPTQITENGFMEKMKKMAKAKISAFGLCD